MTLEQMQSLKTGDIVRGRLFGLSYVVTAHYGTHVTAVRTVDLRTPAEWDLVSAPAAPSPASPLSPRPTATPADEPERP